MSLAKSRLSVPVRFHSNLTSRDRVNLPTVLRVVHDGCVALHRAPRVTATQRIRCERTFPGNASWGVLSSDATSRRKPRSHHCQRRTSVSPSIELRRTHTAYSSVHSQCERLASRRRYGDIALGIHRRPIIDEYDAVLSRNNLPVVSICTTGGTYSFPRGRLSSKRRHSPSRRSSEKNHRHHRQFRGPRIRLYRDIDVL